MKLDPARMQLLIGFLESYVLLTPEQEDRVQQKLAEELPPGEVKKMTEILTSYHKRGMEEGIAALQKALLKQVKRKLGNINQSTEKAIMETNNIPSLEKALELIFDLDSEETLVNLLNK